MYNFVDTTTGSASSSALPSEALQINGAYIENEIDGYRTLYVLGRELTEAEITELQMGQMDGSEYRNSRIRAWLKEAEGQYADYVPVDTGVDTFFTGATQEGSFRQLDAADLTAVPAQDQQMTDQLFLLSLEEALEYRQYLWQFGEETGENENPETQIGNFCRGYWLRTAYGADSSKTPEAAYVVDLVSGSIHPQAAKAEGEDGGDPELAVTVPFGVRPAFALRQQN